MRVKGAVEKLKIWTKEYEKVFIFIGLLGTTLGLIFTGIQIRDNRKIESAKFVLQMSDKLDTGEYPGIITEIEDNGNDYKILKQSGGKIDPRQLEDYVGKLDSVGDLYLESLISERMAYNEFSYDFEKAYCNHDIKAYLDDIRNQDKNFKGFRAFYNGFYVLSQKFLQIDNDVNCKSIDRK